MPEIHPDLIRAKERAEAELLGKPGVTGVDVGYKEVNGQPTNIIAIRVLVAEKKPANKVPADQRIPAEIDGHPTDVIERRFELHTARMLVDDITLQADTGSYTPLKGGISLGPCRAVGGYVYVGTLGAIVRDNDTGNPMMLSNFHVMCIDDGYHTGDTQAQPGLVDAGSCPTDVVGTLARQSLGGSVDCAVADITASRGTACEIVDIGAIAGTNTVNLGDPVRKRGRTTGLTYGNVDSISLSVNIDYGSTIGTKTLTNQIGVKPDTAHNAKFGDHGDSGSVVVNNAREVVGLHFAGDSTGYGIANPIAAVLSALNVSMCTPTIKIKDLKDHKLEKIEIKEFKQEKNEAKDAKIEAKEHKDFSKREIKERKEFSKREIKELKERKEFSKLEIGEKGIGPKEKDGKELKEGGFEGPGGPGGPGDPGPILPTPTGPAAGGKPILADVKNKSELKDHKLEFKEGVKEGKEGKDIKELKPEKYEGKESKPEKFENKEFKQEKNEAKDAKIEFKEHKREKQEIKDTKEVKPEKDGKDFTKEGKVEKLENKEFSKFETGEKGIGPKEKDGKELKEGGFEGPGGPGGPGDPGPFVPGPIEQRLAALEQSIAQLTHFISSAQRPDLTYGALTGEDDVSSQGTQLSAQADAAKSAKDNKDIEKLAE